jgi:hypothetical protein
MGTPHTPSGGLRCPLNPCAFDHSTTGFDIPSHAKRVENRIVTLFCNSPGGQMVKRVGGADNFCYRR